jgi:hypothetical protein
MATPPRMVELECLSCHDHHWTIDHRNLLGTANNRIRLRAREHLKRPIFGWLLRWPCINGFTCLLSEIERLGGGVAYRLAACRT